MPDLLNKCRCLSFLQKVVWPPGRFVKAGLLLFLASSSVFAQGVGDQPYLVEGRVMVSSGMVSDVKAQCILDDEVNDLALDDRGAFHVKLLWNRDYLFKFQKPGYITKSVRFLTHVPDLTQKESIQPFVLMVKISPVMKDVDTAYFRTPVGFVRFSKEINDFEPVTDYDLLVKYNRKFNSESLIHTGSPIVKKGVKGKTGQDISKKGKVETVSKSESFAKTAGLEIKQVSERKKKGFVLPYNDFLEFDSLYQQGITTDTFHLNGQIIKRYILKTEKMRSVFLEVIHDWGPTFYFISDFPGSYRCISQNSFKSLLYKNK
jgi:hypothetical protein